MCVRALWCVCVCVCTNRVRYNPTAWAMAIIFLFSFCFLSRESCECVLLFFCFAVNDLWIWSSAYELHSSQRYLKWFENQIRNLVTQLDSKINNTDLMDFPQKFKHIQGMQYWFHRLRYSTMRSKNGNLLISKKFNHSY